AGGTRWSDPATWGGTLPPAGSLVVIPAGKTVVLDTQTPPLRGLTIEGTLVAADTDIGITSDFVYVKGGRLQIGSAAAPFLRNATVTLTGSGTADNPGTPGFGSKALAMMGGVLELHGAPRSRNWTRLDGGDVPAGARTIRVAEATGWTAGDQIVIATSSFNQAEYSVATIERISGTVITLREPLRYRHFGAARQVGDVTVDVRAEVGLLTQNIVIQGDATSVAANVGGHAMLMAGAGTTTVQIAHVQFQRMGQLDRAGRYPLHFHLMGDGCTGCYVRNTTIRDTIQRGLVLHDTSNVLVAGNVVFNTVGHNIVIETETTRGNTLDGNLALVNRQPMPRHTDPLLVVQNDRLPGNYWFRGADNAIVNNVAAGSQSNGFIYDQPGAGSLNFRNNVAHAAMGLSGANEGDFDVMAGVMIVSERPAGHRDQVLDTLVYHSSHGIWPEESLVPYVIDRFIVAENGIGVQNRGVGSKQVYRNGVFIGQLPGSSAMPAPGLPMHNQYGSDNRIENATFAHYPAGISFAGTDTMPTQSSFTFSNARFIGARPAFELGGDMSRMSFLDDSILSRGYYVDARAPWLAYPGCTRVAGGDAGHFRCATEPGGMGELELRTAPGAGFGQRVDAALARSDGLRYSRGTAGVAAGMHSTTVLHSVPGLSYTIENAAPFYALRLWDIGGDVPIVTGHARLRVAVPMAAPPRAVARAGAVPEFAPGADPGAGGDALPPMSGAEPLRALASATELDASPLAGYWYDAAARVLWLNVTPRWVMVQP
nr:hypothetical protein [Burkholderiaceae bacterium]